MCLPERHAKNACEHNARANGRLTSSNPGRARRTWSQSTAARTARNNLGNVSLHALAIGYNIQV